MRIAENLLAQKNCFMIRLRYGVRRKIGEPNHVAVQPLPIWLFGSYFVFELRVVDDASFASVDEQHLAGLKTSFEDYLFWRDIKYPNLRRHDDEAVLGHRSEEHTSELQSHSFISY